MKAENKARIFCLDLVRAVAVLMIIAYHYLTAVKNLSGLSQFLTAYTPMGRLAVSIFFVLSGASLAISHGQSRSVWDFYRKRWMRIFPLFYGAYLFVLIMNFVLAGQFRPPAWRGRSPALILFTLVGMDGLVNAVIPCFYLVGEWFLGCLVAVYTVFPALLRFFDVNGKLTLLASFAVALVVQEFYSGPFLLERVFPLRLFEVCFGIAVARAAQRYGGWVAGCRQVMIPLLLLFTVTLILPTRTSFLLGTAFPGITMFICLVWLGCRVRDARIRQALSFISMYSYAAFLLHHQILKRIVAYAPNRATNAFTAVPMSMSTVALVFLSSVVLQKLVAVTIRRVKAMPHVSATA